MTLKLSTLVTFPARVIAQQGLSLVKQSGVFSFALRFRDYAQTTPTDDMQVVTFIKGAAEDGSEDVYSTVSLSDLKTYLSEAPE